MFQDAFELLKVFIAESGVIHRGFIVFTMGQFDLLGFGGKTLQQRLNGPGFALACAFPKQLGYFFG